MSGWGVVLLTGYLRLLLPNTLNIAVFTTFVELELDVKADFILSRL